jgi:hypothetical protein
VQATGKSRRTSNIWNRRGDASDRDGFSSGDPLGFVLERHTIYERNFDVTVAPRVSVTKTDVNEKAVDNVRFSLSSNPNTALNVQPMSLDTFLPYIGHYSVLTPSSSVKEAHSSETCMKTFLQFACANQMCRSMNTNQSRIQLAHEALQCGGCPPIEIIMRRKFYDHRCHEVGKTTESVRMYARKLYGLSKKAEIAKMRAGVPLTIDVPDRYKNTAFIKDKGSSDSFDKFMADAIGAAVWRKKAHADVVSYVTKASDIEATRLDTILRLYRSVTDKSLLLQIEKAAVDAAAAKVITTSKFQEIYEAAGTTADAKATELAIPAFTAFKSLPVTAVGATAVETGVGQPMDVEPAVEAVQESAAGPKARKKKVMLE